ncbi:MAG: hypothetical protein DK306_000647 [Chloroflexi bacterium]|jgi:hypothetical protein|nr:MAG: hypothetical protein DK306_000647 [Chloroflexota bacterium]
MQSTIPPFQGEAVRDERQLDGSRHLTVDLVDSFGSWYVSLHSILDREGGLREAELELESPDGPWSGGLDVVEQISGEGPLRLRATFEDAGFHLRLDLQEFDDGAGFAATLEPDAV